MAAGWWISLKRVFGGDYDTADEYPGGQQAIPGTVEVDGISFPVVSKVSVFAENIEGRKRSAMLMPTVDYGKIQKNAYERLSLEHGSESPAVRSLLSAQLVCQSCKQQFPESFALMLSGMLDSVPGFIIMGDGGGHEEAAKAGKCPYCGGAYSFLVYDDPAAGGVSESDVEAIRQYWRHLAREWWKKESRQEAICDHCNAAVPRDTGYLSGSWLYCEDCGKETLGASALYQLQGNPNYFGTGLLRKARQFARRR